jgi:hypothetical protein
MPENHSSKLFLYRVILLLEVICFLRRDAKRLRDLAPLLSFLFKINFLLVRPSKIQQPAPSNNFQKVPNQFASA